MVDPRGVALAFCEVINLLMSRLPRKMLRSPLKHPTGVFLNAAFNSPPSQIVKTWKSHRKGGFLHVWKTASATSKGSIFPGSALTLKASESFPTALSVEDRIQESQETPLPEIFPKLFSRRILRRLSARWSVPAPVRIPEISVLL